MHDMFHPRAWADSTICIYAYYQKNKATEGNVISAVTTHEEEKLTLQSLTKKGREYREPDALDIPFNAATEVTLSIRKINGGKMEK